MKGHAGKYASIPKNQITAYQADKKSIAALNQIQMGNAKQQGLQNVQKPEGCPGSLQIFCRHPAENQLLLDGTDDGGRKNREETQGSDAGVIHQIRICIHPRRIQKLPYSQEDSDQKLHTDGQKQQLSQIPHFKQGAFSNPLLLLPLSDAHIIPEGENQENKRVADQKHLHRFIHISIRSRCQAVLQDVTHQLYRRSHHLYPQHHQQGQDTFQISAYFFHRNLLL